MTLPIKPAAPSLLAGIDAILAGQPIEQNPQSFAGVSTPPSSSSALVPTTDPGAAPAAAGPAPKKLQGPLFEASDADAFNATHAQVLRQEPLAMSRLALDKHYTYVKLGYGLFSTLKKEPNKDIYSQRLEYGANAISMAGVPNKIWDQCNKTVETLLQDFPEPEAEPDDDSEEATNACQIANRFLKKDGSEQGTNDAVLYYDRAARSLVGATGFIEYWVDSTGGGWVPLQIKAHPLAVDANNPLVDPAGMPTTDYILRYVTADGQFTDNPAEAAPQWQPKIRASKWEREHVRMFPENGPLDQARQVIVLGYCTIGEAKERWPEVAAMADEQLTSLLDWTPPRYIELLPPFQRARWRAADGREKEKQAASDERIIFYYHLYRVADRAYPKGCDLVLSGASGGMKLHQDTLSADVQITPPASQSAQPGPAASSAPAPVAPGASLPVPLAQAPMAAPAPQKVTETRCMEIPLVAVTLRPDPDEKDPTGRCYVEMLAGAAENNSYLASSFAELIDKILHQPFAIQSTSPIEGWQVEDARATGDFLLLNTPEDEPKQLPVPVLPTAFFNMYELTDEALNSMGSTERGAHGGDNAQERSGKAITLARSLNNVTLSSMLTALTTAYARGCRIKIQLAMKWFTTPQQLSYTGEDGAYKQDDWTGVDFARVGKVTIKAGTGTMMPPDQKVEYIATLAQGPVPLIPPDEAAEAARPSFAKRLGLPDNPHEQYVARCIDAWLKGPPEGWEQQYQTWFTAQQQFQAQVAAFTAQQAAAPTGPALVPPDAGAPQGAPQGALPPQAPQIPMPWTPFAPRPNDDEPQLAAIWVRRLSRVISSVKFSGFTPGWQQILTDKYLQERQYLAPPPMPAPVPGDDGSAGKPPEAEPPSNSIAA